MLGHASAAMTLDVYAGLFADDLDAVADRLDEAARQGDAGLLRTIGPSEASETAADEPGTGDSDDDDGPDDASALAS
jgi:hypothetical protein